MNSGCFPEMKNWQSSQGTINTAGAAARVAAGFLNVTDVTRWLQQWTVTITDLSSLQLDRDGGGVILLAIIS